MLLRWKGIGLNNDLAMLARQFGYCFYSYRIRIRDNGKGIPPKELGRITEAFYMVDKSRSRKQHGAGLGLALVSKIVRIHRAQMQIESDGKMGTVISIGFPMHEGGADEENI